MPIEVLMPALSPTMTEGKLARWVKREGETVNSGDVIAEIETDKATMEVEAVDEGVLGKILVAEGSEHVAVNTPIAMILVEGEDAKALTAGTPAPAKAAAPAPAAPAAAPAAPPSPSPAAPAQAAGARIFASPLAKRMAAEAGLDLAAIKGSGPRGRIIKADVEAAKQAPSAAKPAAAPQAAKPAPAAAPAAAPQPFETPYVEVANSTMRKVIARRLSDSKRDIPHYYLTIECNIDPLLELRDKLNARTGEGPAAFKLSVNDFVIRAVALALRAYPDANCSWTDEAIRFYQTVDVAVAVAAPNGLITPIVRNADAKGLAAISNEIKHLAGRARESKLMPEEYVGGGFTVSNLGMYGIKEFAAIINPPQSCLLAVGAAEKRPIVKDGALAIGTMMSCTLSADHRSVDGAKGASFLKVFKGLIEDPLTMLL
ncbi:MAG: pyruvate dehydrogenase complex dihydrolipoamide acetyltransferase [Rhodospirillales bacterium]|nr:pyruvate dehydrogenase complex dihydrolipoamide acetyltransferase [Rhodospirillales bacterium]